MSNISYPQLVKNIADAYRTASGTTEKVKYGELASKVEQMSTESFPITVTFMNGTEEWAKVGVDGEGKIAEPTEPSGTGLFGGWKDGDVVVSFPYKPNNNKILTATFVELAYHKLYNFYGVSITEYPYLFVTYSPPKSYQKSSVYVYFVKSAYYDGLGLRMDNQYYTSKTDLVIPDDSSPNWIANYIIENIPNDFHTQTGTRLNENLSSWGNLSKSEVLAIYSGMTNYNALW